MTTKKNSQAKATPRGGRKANNKKSRAKSRASGVATGPSMGSVPKPFSMATAPVAMALTSGQGQFAKVIGRKRGKDGLEIVTIEGRQLLQKALLRSTTSQVLTTAEGAAVPGIPLAPYYIGGLCQTLCQGYSSFAFENAELEYFPASASSQAAPIAMGFQPNVLDPVMIAGEDEGGVSGALFRGISSLASMAAGPVWGPIAMRVGEELGSTLMESARKWYNNVKVAGGLITDVTDEQTVDDFLYNQRVYDSLLDTFLAANAAALTSGTRPTPPAVALSSLKERRVAAIRRERLKTMRSAMDASTQGMLFAATDGPYTGAVDGSGLAPAGEIYFKYRVNLAGPVDQQSTTSASSSKTGDPLDDVDADPFHKAYAPSDRSRYLFTSLLDSIAFTAPPPRPQIAGIQPLAVKVQQMGRRFQVGGSQPDAEGHVFRGYFDGEEFEVRAPSRTQALHALYQEAIRRAGSVPAIESGPTAVPTSTWARPRSEDQEWYSVLAEIQKIEAALPTTTRLGPAIHSVRTARGNDGRLNALAIFAGAFTMHNEAPASYKTSVGGWLSSMKNPAWETPSARAKVYHQLTDPWFGEGDIVVVDLPTSENGAD